MDGCHCKESQMLSYIWIKDEDECIFNIFNAKPTKFDDIVFQSFKSLNVRLSSVVTE